MKTRILTIAAAALWATAITVEVIAFRDRDALGLFASANLVALVACVPTFYLAAESLLERHMEKVSLDHDDLLRALCRSMSRAGAERDVTHVDSRR